MSRRDQRGQSTVELALALPVVVMLLLLVVQAGLAVRDRLVVLHAARTAARAVIVEPDPGGGRCCARPGRAPARGPRSRLAGELRPGGLATVTVTMAPTRVPVVGRVVAGGSVVERLTVLVEG